MVQPFGCETYSVRVQHLRVRWGRGGVTARYKRFTLISQTSRYNMGGYLHMMLSGVEAYRVNTGRPPYQRIVSRLIQLFRQFVS